MGGITQPQLRKIYASARERGLDSELLHGYVQALTGKESLKELTGREAAALIDSLEGKGATVRNPASPRQMAYIKGLMKGLGWTGADGSPDMERLDGMCRKYAKCGNHKQLDKSGASGMIEALKGMQGREPGRNI